jgi:uncharacterized protein
MIRSVTDHEIRIGDDVYGQTVALTAETIIHDWPDTAIGDLQEQDFSMLLRAEPEVIVLGTGVSNVFPPRELVFSMARLGVGFEVMDTAAAARTFNVLIGEGRQVAAVLYV